MPPARETVEEQTPVIDDEEPEELELDELELDELVTGDPELGEDLVGVLAVVGGPHEIRWLLVELER